MSEGELVEAAETASEIISEEFRGAGDTRWKTWVAVSSMVMAMISAVGALLAGVTANEAVISRTEEIIKVTNRDRNQVQMEILKTRRAILLAIESPGEQAVQTQMQSVDQKIDQLNKETKSDDLEIEEILRSHELFAIGVTLLSIAITLAGLAVVTEWKPIWRVGLVFSVIGTVAVCYGCVLMST